MVRGRIYKFTGESKTCPALWDVEKTSTSSVGQAVGVTGGSEEGGRSSRLCASPVPGLGNAGQVHQSDCPILRGRGPQHRERPWAIVS